MLTVVVRPENGALRPQLHHQGIERKAVEHLQRGRRRAPGLGQHLDLMLRGEEHLALAHHLLDRGPLGIQEDVHGVSPDEGVRRAALDGGELRVRVTTAQEDRPGQGLNRAKLRSVSLESPGEALQGGRFAAHRLASRAPGIRRQVDREQPRDICELEEFDEIGGAVASHGTGDGNRPEVPGCKRGVGCRPAELAIEPGAWGFHVVLGDRSDHQQALPVPHGAHCTSDGSVRNQRFRIGTRTLSARIRGLWPRRRSTESAYSAWGRWGHRLPSGWKRAAKWSTGAPVWTWRCAASLSATWPRLVATPLPPP